MSLTCEDHVTRHSPFSQCLWMSPLDLESENAVVIRFGSTPSPSSLPWTLIKDALGARPCARYWGIVARLCIEYVGGGRRHRNLEMFLCPCSPPSA